MPLQITGDMILGKGTSAIVIEAQPEGILIGETNYGLIKKIPKE
jgi:hypothetical protein